MKKLLLVSSAAIFSAACLFGEVEENLLPEGKMVGSVGFAPRGWESPHPSYLDQIGASIEMVEEDDSTFVRLTNVDPEKSVSMKTVLEIEPDWVGQKLIISAGMRAADLVVGEQGWQTARIALSFKTPEGKTDYPQPLSLDMNQPEWLELTSEWKVPEGVVLLEINIALFHTTGTLDVKNLTVELE